MPKKMKIAEALNTIYKQSKNSGLNPELFKELKKEIKATYENTAGKVETTLSEYETKSKEVGIEPEKMEAFTKLKALKTEMENLIK